MFKAITVPNAAPEHPEELDDFVRRSKPILYNREMDVADLDNAELPDDIGRINEKWLADPRNHVGIRFWFHFALRRMTDFDADMKFAGKRFTLSPIFRTYAHHAIVDHECLYGIMIEARDIRKTSLAKFKSQAIMQWDSVFKRNTHTPASKSRGIEFWIYGQDGWYVGEFPLPEAMSSRGRPQLSSRDARRRWCVPLGCGPGTP